MQIKQEKVLVLSEDCRPVELPAAVSDRCQDTEFVQDSIVLMADQDLVYNYRKLLDMTR